MEIAIFPIKHLYTEFRISDNPSFLLLTIPFVDVLARFPQSENVPLFRPPQWDNLLPRERRGETGEELSHGKGRKSVVRPCINPQGRAANTASFKKKRFLRGFLFARRSLQYWMTWVSSRANTDKRRKSVETPQKSAPRALTTYNLPKALLEATKLVFEAAQSITWFCFYTI